ncbi:PREDICTED: NADPH:adrenodoxin oxidoreductase, mitochondrial isoform X1 [Polistes canadensis]|uniref:NADPH:adrenodoxin oxidoreductase, mitochondrial isoform X1 n=2 Tax=Polistes canadensis TaxID=91411 RepID=UPI000718BA75|nr:PREDICTED: NADPH:adrenodoxin oxidoreductase, mitochondrial isoform X1 [Polistes canadensis]XP_014616512.1 PREDICTED: NADPH:adrenodoxin oxidoreductase, mitochondrial isoform X1 [Polistes canadensis]
MKCQMIFNNIRLFSTENIIPKVCVVGAGPAGFYAAQQLVKTSKDIRVDILERLPVPFGLVRFGVAPDHPEVKNVINTFHKTAMNPRIQFIGNVNVGKDVTVDQLQELYHAVLLTYGAEEDKLLNIPGEDLSNVISGRRFVGWYNGLPSDKNLNINLDVEEAVILGQGNVAIDIARILLTPIDHLKSTDITTHALEQLSNSKVRKVQLVGRRGPLQAAFTIAELREILRLKNCTTFWRAEDFTGINEIVPTLARPRKRLTELMLKSLNEQSINHTKITNELHPIFLRSPIEFLGCKNIEKIKFSVNKLEGDNISLQKAIPTNEIEKVSCSIAFRSIGYRSIQIDKSIPFDNKNGRVNNVGKVKENLYAAGWVATGPVGVILSTMTNAFEIASLINKELSVKENKLGSEGLHKILNMKNIPTVSYSNWEKIDQVERQRGKDLGKPREKIVSISEMLNIALN